MRASRLRFLTIACVAFLFGSAEAQTPTIKTIVDLYANASIANGFEPGIEIALVIGDNETFFSYGLARVAANQAVTQDSPFQIGSVTKVFTSNLLEQAVAANAGGLSLTTTLGDLSSQLGGAPTNDKTKLITLGQLANFTAGLPRDPPLCANGNTQQATGCLPNPRPQTDKYFVQNFATFFRTCQLEDNPPRPFSYSNAAYGLIGLLLGDPSGAPLTNTAISGWYSALWTELLHPLNMNATGYAEYSTGTGAQGYTQATADAKVQALAPNGIKSVEMVDKGAAVVGQGGGYAAPPAVSIRGGGGRGAVLSATLNSQSGIDKIEVEQPGSGYVGAPEVDFSGGGPPTRKAEGAAIISDGRVAGVLLKDGGLGYTSAPTVTITGGRPPDSGADAQLTATVTHGAVNVVRVDQGGSGYVDPLTVVIPPSSPTVPIMPVWAPAGALWSTATDMATFVQAALLHTNIGGLAVPPAVTTAFEEAEKPTACAVGPPTGCPIPTIGMAWVILPRDVKTIGKDGQVTGFAAQVLLMPQRKSGIAVMTNSTHGNAPELAKQILYALDDAHLLPRD